MAKYTFRTAIVAILLFCSEELAQRLQAEEDFAAQQAQEQQATPGAASGGGRRIAQPVPTQSSSLPSTSSNSRQAQGQDSQRSKNVRINSILGTNLKLCGGA